MPEPQEVPRRRLEDKMGKDFVSTQSFDRLSAAFENSARRWELIVYPSLFAFILLAGYGFYLVYHLAKDVHYLAISVDTNMTVLASNMQSVSDNMNRLTDHVNVMTASLNSIDNNVRTLEPMLTNISAMERPLQSMTWSTSGMRRDMSNMNQNISRPMSFMNGVMPW
jgi:uncharacterized protein YoxC